MTYYNNEQVHIGDFVTWVVTEAAEAGWTNPGGNTICPSGYSSFYVEFTSDYSASLIYNDGGASGGGTTYITVTAGAGISSNHPVITTAGGVTRFRMNYGNTTDYSTSTSGTTDKHYYIRGWIDSKTIAISVAMDPTVNFYSKHFIFVGEVEAVEASANTCMLNSTEIYTNSRYGDGAYNDTNNNTITESSFIHTLGDGVGYYPWAYGVGTSYNTGKVRASPVYIWKRENSIDKPHNVAYRVPTSILRVSLGGLAANYSSYQYSSAGGNEAEDDTFTDGANTFTRMGNPDTDTKITYTGKFAWCKPMAYLSMTAAGCPLLGNVWVRSA